MVVANYTTTALITMECAPISDFSEPSRFHGQWHMNWGSKFNAITSDRDHQDRDKDCGAKQCGSEYVLKVIPKHS